MDRESATEVAVVSKETGPVRPSRMCEDTGGRGAVTGATRARLELTRSDHDLVASEAAPGAGNKDRVMEVALDNEDCRKACWGDPRESVFPTSATERPNRYLTVTDPSPPFHHTSPSRDPLVTVLSTSYSPPTYSLQTSDAWLAWRSQSESLPVELCSIPWGEWRTIC